MAGRMIRLVADVVVAKEIIAGDVETARVRACGPWPMTRGWGALTDRPAAVLRNDHPCRLQDYVADPRVMYPPPAVAGVYPEGSAGCRALLGPGWRRSSLLL